MGWVALSAQNHRQLWVPAGFAHGFYVTSDTAEFVYKCSDYYYPQSEVSISWEDPDLGIQWPLVNGKPPALSAKDADGQRFIDAPKFD
ncbi:MAG: dTDP-4-dehydrorhamnose 3,5-epimerase [Paraglaciecola sp.]|jgi:dTDP-4-dehydrorhamnose 3,5-epimerase